MGKKRRVADMAGHLPEGSLVDHAVVATLDLHGKSAAQAERLARDFILTSSRGAAGRVVRIVTGNGTGSPGQPVLKPLVRRWLETEPSRYVEVVLVPVPLP